MVIWPPKLLKFMALQWVRWIYKEILKRYTWNHLELHWRMHLGTCMESGRNDSTCLSREISLISQKIGSVVGHHRKSGDVLVGNSGGSSWVISERVENFIAEVVLSSTKWNERGCEESGKWWWWKMTFGNKYWKRRADLPFGSRQMESHLTRHTDCFCYTWTQYCLRSFLISIPHPR